MTCALQGSIALRPAPFAPSHLLKPILSLPVYPACAGFHLATADCLDRIPPTVADIAALAPAVVVAGHCTGWRAQATLQAALPGRCMPCSVGSTYEFSAPAADVGE